MQTEHKEATKDNIMLRFEEVGREPLLEPEKSCI